MKSLIGKRPSFRRTTVDIGRALVPPPIIVPNNTKERPSGLIERVDVRSDAWCACEIFANGTRIREAVVLDISKSGARVRSRVRGLLPRYVVIKAGRLGLNRSARVVWQDTYTAGLQFISPKPVSPRQSVEL